MMVPLYLPLVTDDPATPGDAPIFFGGINVYLQQHSGLFRRLPRWMDRILDSPRLLRWVAGRASMTQPAGVGELTLSMLSGESGRQIKELDRLVGWLGATGRPDVVCLSNSLLVGMVRRIKSALDVPVICSLQGEDAFLDGLPDPYRARAWAALTERAADVDRFLAMSRYHGDLMQERLGLSADRLEVVYNGIDPTGYEPAERPVQPPVIGYLARLCPLKGLDVLVEAFIRLKRGGRVPDVRLHVAGTTTGDDKKFVAGLGDRLDRAGMMNDVTFAADIDRDAKQAFLRGLSVLSVPARRGEAFGMYLLEAWASGVPVVQPRSGPFPELIEATGGGILCPPDDAQGLAEALETLLLDRDRAEALGRRGREAVGGRFSVERMARDVARICQAARGATG